MRLSRSSTASTRRNRSRYGGYLRVSSGENGRPPATTPENYQFRALTFALLPRGKLIHPPSWNRNSTKFAKNSSPTQLRWLDRLEDEPRPPRTDDLLQPVAIQLVGLVHQHRDLGRSLVGGRPGRLFGLPPRLPQAERQTLA